MNAEDPARGQGLVVRGRRVTAAKGGGCLRPARAFRNLCIRSDRRRLLPAGLGDPLQPLRDVGMLRQRVAAFARVAPQVVKFFPVDAPFDHFARTAVVAGRSVAEVVVREDEFVRFGSNRFEVVA